jgi:ankyrin repeat protein
MNQRNRYQAFVRAAEAGDAGRIVAIVRAHPELHTVEGDEGGLLSVLYHSAPHLFEAAFAAGLSPDCTEVLTIPLLHQAAADGNESLVALALQYGADVERRSKEGESALGYAIAWSHLSVVRALVQAGANVNGIEESLDGLRWMPLAACTDAAIEEFLVQRGATRTIETAEG